MMRSITLCCLLGAVAVLGTAPGAIAQQDMRIEQVVFPAGATGTTIRDTITGRESVAYKLGAEAGQTMSIELRSSNTAIYFNVYEPGRGPGDQALAVSGMTGAMVPDLNRFRGTLVTSGVYTVSVYLYRSAARRGERADYVLDVSATPPVDLTKPVQGDFADGLQGAPDYYVVRTSGGALNLRSAPSTGARVLGRLANGTPLRNLGCRMTEGRRWCNVATLSDPGIVGWAAGSYLTEGAGNGGIATHLPDMIPVPEAPDTQGDALVPGTNFHATGQITCARSFEAAVRLCDFGVIREGSGNGSVTVFWPEGGSRVILFERGTPIDYDQSQAESDAKVRVAREGDTSIVTIGEERFEIPDAVIFGG